MIKIRLKTTLYNSSQLEFSWNCLCTVLLWILVYKSRQWAGSDVECKNKINQFTNYKIRPPVIIHGNNWSRQIVLGRAIWFLTFYCDGQFRLIKQNFFMVYKCLMIWVFSSSSFKLSECVVDWNMLLFLNGRSYNWICMWNWKEEYAWFIYVGRPELQSYLFFLNPASAFGMVPMKIPTFTKIHSFRDELIRTPEIESITFVLLEAPDQVGF